jgi:hypothetical protein
MSSDEKPSPNPASSHNGRNDLLDELESIRHLLKEGNDAPPFPSEHDRIPLLIPDDNIPTLGAEHRHHTTRKKRPPSLSASLSSPRDREKLVEDVVRNALPRLESILRELVQEALLQEKLRGGKR